MKKFFDKFDKKRFLFVAQIAFIFLAFAIIVDAFSDTYSRYESNVDLNANANVAFFIIDQGTYENTISLTGLEPRTDPFYFTFYVANYNLENKRSKVDMNYNIKFETTTNLPLTYEIIRNQSFQGSYTNIISSTTTRQDEYDVFYKVLANSQTYNFYHNRNELDIYKLKVIFPESYNNYPNLYQGGVELFSIIIDAEQVA